MHAVEVTAQVRALQETERARLMAETANRAKDEFLAMLGHELRNPLAPILTALQLMHLRGDDKATKERAVIERQVRHLMRLVDDLLDVSRIARGKIELNKEPVEIAEVIARAIETASPLLEEQQHDLQVNVPRSGLLVNGDVTRLAQVVMNLLTNAAKYTDARGHIAVTAQKRRDIVELSIRDNGISIAADMLSRVFELFSQERQALDRSQGGLGLGLTIVRSLVKLHDGTVQAFSDGPGRGSEFLIRLPRAETAAAPRARASKAKPKLQQRRRRILIVDDNVDAAHLIADALGAAGHDVEIAYDGPKALTVVRRFQPDVALLDLGLPVMDGYELAGHLRAGSGNGGDAPFSWRLQDMARNPAANARMWRAFTPTSSSLWIWST